MASINSEIEQGINSETALRVAPEMQKEETRADSARGSKRSHKASNDKEVILRLNDLAQALGSLEMTYNDNWRQSESYFSDMYAWQSSHNGFGKQVVTLLKSFSGDLQILLKEAKEHRTVETRLTQLTRSFNRRLFWIVMIETFIITTGMGTLFGFWLFHHFFKIQIG